MKKTFLTLALLPLIMLSSCKDNSENETQEFVRSVKTIEITKANKDKFRSITGVVIAADNSDLSFRVGGRIIKVNVDAGDLVTKGQILAEIEQRDFDLALQSAKAQLSQSRANLVEKTDNLRRQTALRKKDFVSKADFEKAQAEYQVALSEVSVAESGLKNATDNIDRTILKAPFSGKIAARNIEPYTEIVAGYTVFELESNDAFKVETRMPETLVRQVNSGDLTKVTFPTLKDIEVGAEITRIASKAEAGNAFPIEVTLADNLHDIRPGMTANVYFNFAGNPDSSIYLIPVTALDLRFFDKDLGLLKEQAAIYLYDKESSTVKMNRVKINDIRGNSLEVIQGLKEGDVVITAGVSFLQDGQKVKLWDPKYSVPATLDK
ncbi:MAG: RND family efflux transporter MFP subunit [Rickettsiales bacterium]|jgi:RND family efflux transporter MFP subunit